MKNLLHLLCFVFSLTTFANEGSGNIRVKINNIKNNNGNMLISLCKTKDEFKGKKDAFVGKIVEIEDQTVEVVFENVNYGEYAIIVLHDENKNNKMDFKIMFPKEGYGASNNKINMGPPNYSKSLFTHANGLLEMEIDLVYVGK